MLSLYNTLSRSQGEFEPIKFGQVGLYTCGPTVYQYAHIGNLRTYIFEDVLRRTLELNKLKVKHVMNVTDVGHLTGDRDMGEDKIEQEAKKEKKTAWEIAEFYGKVFFQDLEKLNILKPHIISKATATIADQIKLVQQLEKKGFTYKTSDGIYFDTSKLPDYGKLANLDLEGLQEGARVEINKEKKNPTDFALWKFSYPEGRSFDPAQDDEATRRQMEWDSPWGKGFPGWHIECSAISTKHLGQPFDIHAGGIDHVPVHHTNEIAQSEAAEEKALANYWLHGEFLIINEERMAKSEGNFITLETVVKKGFNPLAFRYFVLGAHYRSKLNFTWEALEATQNALDNIYDKVRYMGNPDGACLTDRVKEFMAAVNDDLDTPKALAIFWETLKGDDPESAKLATLLYMDQVLGLNLEQVSQEKIEISKEVKDLVAQREAARQKDDYKLSDKLRQQIADLGFYVEDTPDGPQVKKIN